MAEKVILSQQFRVSAREFLKGLILAVGTPILYLLQDQIPGWDLDPIVQAGLSAGITYLINTFFKPAQVTTTYSSNSKAVEIANDIKSE